jgi:hypothetical protein
VAVSATRDFQSQSREQWQVKVSDSARIWYLPDDEKRTVWVIYASPAHPKKAPATWVMRTCCASGSTGGIGQ